MTIKTNFWDELKNTDRPILALAPMAGFTDTSFRQICRQQGADVVYSEMASVAALHYYATAKKPGRDNGGKVTMELVRFNRRLEKYYVVQLFGSNPEHFATAARFVTKKIKPDGLDINFGCPAGKVLKQGAGADLMKDLKRSRAVIKAVLDNTNLPVSIKLRAKSGEVGVLEFLDNIADLPVAAVMIHGRTLAQGFVGAPDFKLIKEARQHFSGVIIANGGINSLHDAKNALAESQADGLGLARGILGRPWLFKEIKNNQEQSISQIEILKLMLKHASLAVKLKGEGVMLELRKHLVWYVQSFPGASRLRSELVAVSCLADLKKIIKSQLLFFKAQKNDKKPPKITP